MEKRSRRLLPMVALLFLIGGGSISRSSQSVRTVDAVRLSGGGAAIGVGFILLVLALSGKISEP